MADADKTQESKIVQEQFRRTLDHIIIDASKVGPEITIGETTLQFKSKAPVRALAVLVGNPNRVEGMIDYLKMCLVKGQEEEFDAVLDDVDVDGLGEILSAVGEGYTSFQNPS